jgi:hypothetical protein
MTSERLGLLAIALALAPAACGNYSNEDLLYMSAVPSSSQLAVVLPASTNPNQAELAQNTHNGITNVNTMLDDVLGIIDAVRAYEPTSRTANSRTWGPFPDMNHPGWQWQLVVTQQDAVTYTYDLDTENTTLATPAWVPFLTGSFDFAGGAKQGSGSVMANFDALRAAYFPLDMSSMSLDTLRIDYQNYQTTGAPVAVTLAITQTPDANGVNAVTFTYEIADDGSGVIAFSLTGNVVPGPAIETVAFNAGWLSSGAGKATLAVVSGDGAGLTQTECWDATFGVTYNDKPWSSSEDKGDPSLCPPPPSF